MSPRKPWKQRAPVNVWRTWPDDHVTAREPSERSTAILSRLQWKTTAASYCTSSAARHGLFFQVSLRLCTRLFCVFFLPPFSFPSLSLDCVSIFRRAIPLIPAFQTPPPLRLEILSESCVGEKSKAVVLNICQLAKHVVVATT